ncbi:membrane progestin receptor gamma-A-like [Lytechinus variegatus]|uniref:membrane progestin receptor gamma-A-like n=1 Tax=Lytechinus variegatus TaxID=7654 RepID=UPI001BB1010B|nr:membrane progestin receptor gamma-A-like [Lytechinus variegatus]
MWTLKLLRFDQVPSDFREPFIISGYRSCQNSASSCLASALQRTNETINFWTHFIPAIIFLRLTWMVAVTDQGFAHDPSMWPVIVFLFGTFCYTMASSVAHMFNSMSQCARHTFFFIDYVGISMYSLGVCIACYAYSFPPELIDTALYHVYIPVAMVTAFGSTYLACCSRFSTWAPLRDGGRLPAFAIPYIWCKIPLVYRLIYCESTGCDSDALYFQMWQFYFIFGISLLYSTRFPEVIAPGRFDFIGHSHQFFHIGSSLASYCHYLAFLAELEERPDFIEQHGMPTFVSTFGVFLAVLVGNVAIVWVLSLWVVRMKSSSKATIYSD